MKTTQLTSKVLVAAMLLSIVSPVIAVETPAFLKTAWEKTKSAANTTWDKTKSATSTVANATKKLVLPEYPTQAEKNEALTANGIVLDSRASLVDKDSLDKHIIELQNHYDEVVNDPNLTDEFKSVECSRLNALCGQAMNERNEFEKSFFRKNIADKATKFNIEHPNVVKYSAMTAVVAVVSTLAGLAYKYQVPQKAWNKIKSFFKTEPVLNKIITTAEAMVNGKEVKEDLTALVKSAQVAKALESCTQNKKALIDAINTFTVRLAEYNSNNNDKTKAALVKANEALVAAVNACNAEMNKQEAQKQLAKTSSSNTPAQETTTQKPATTTTPIIKQAAHVVINNKAGMGIPRNGNGRGCFNGTCRR